MNYSKIKEICRKGYIGIIPGWNGRLKWDYSKDQLCFINEDYSISGDELKEKIINRNDLYYII